MAKRDEYVVGMLFAYEDRTEIKYVTEIDTQTKYAKWEDGKEAIILSKDYAKDVAWALCINGYPAIVMLKPDYLTLQNPKANEENHIKNTDAE